MIDKALINGGDMGLSTTGDFETVSESMCNLQAAQNRCLSYLWTWLYDENFWNGLGEYLKDSSAFSITESVVAKYTEEALKPLLDDGRLTEIVHIKILERNTDSILIEIAVKVGTQVWEITYELTI